MKDLILIILYSSTLFSQSFDWEVDNRLPFYIPKTYIGGGFSYGLSNHNGNINVNHELIDIAQFKDGEGNALNFSANIEHWYKSNLAFQFQIGYSKTIDNFNNKETYPFFNSEDLVLRNEYTLNTSYILISLGSKYRLYDKLNVGMNFNYNTILNSEHIFNQNILLPEWYTFKNGSKESEIFNDANKDSKNLILLSLQVSYDIQLNYPSYISPFLSISKNLNSQINNSDFNTYFVNFGVKYYYGIKLN